jgi:chromosome segregation ATPase
MAALEAARKRVARADAETGAFRAPLDVALDPLDGPADIEGKIVILDSEEARVRRRLEELKADAVLLTVRVAARREWARELGAARRDALGAVELLDQGYEDVQASLKALEGRADEIARERGRLEAALAPLTARRGQAEERLAELRKGR